MPHMEYNKIMTEDDFALHLTCFGKGEKGITVIFNCATAVPQQFYYRYAEYVSSHGYRCICWDYRGVGKSSGDTIKDANYSLGDWGNEDMNAVLRYAKAQNPEHKLIVFGHSIGGAVLGFCKEHALIDGLIFHAVQSAYFKDWRFPYNIRLIVEWHILLPLITLVFGYFPGERFGLGTNVPKKYVLHWSKRLLHPDIKSLFAKMGERLYFDEYDCPFFCFNMTDDYIATPKAVKRMNAAFPKLSGPSLWISPKEIGHKKVGHFNFFKPKYKDTLWGTSLTWIDAVS